MFKNALLVILTSLACLNLFPYQIHNWKKTWIDKVNRKLEIERKKLFKKFGFNYSSFHNFQSQMTCKSEKTKESEVKKLLKKHRIVTDSKVINAVGDIAKKHLISSECNTFVILDDTSELPYILKDSKRKKCYIFINVKKFSNDLNALKILLLRALGAGDVCEHPEIIVPFLEKRTSKNLCSKPCDCRSEATYCDISGEYEYDCCEDCFDKQLAQYIYLHELRADVFAAVNEPHNIDIIINHLKKDKKRMLNDECNQLFLRLYLNQEKRIKFLKQIKKSFKK